MAAFNPPGSMPKKRKSGDIDNLSSFPRKRPTTTGPYSGVTEGTCWVVQWRNPQQKKHKTWQGDGVLLVQGFSYSLYDTEARPLGVGQHKLPRMLEEGDEIVVGSKEVLLDCLLPLADFRSGACFNKISAFTPAASQKDITPPYKFQPVHKPFIPLQPSNSSSSGPVLTNPKLVVNRLYPTVAGPQPDITDLFEDNGKQIDDRYKAQVGSKLNSSIENLWAVNWRNHTTKKNKTWDGDGLLHQKGRDVRFLSEDGKKVYGKKAVDTVLSIGTTLSFEGKQVKIDCKLPLSRLQNLYNAATASEGSSTKPTLSNVRNFRFKAPSMTKKAEIQVPQPKSNVIGPLHDPSAPGAIVMKMPSRATQLRYNSKQRPLVPVVIDPLLAQKLRPHQVEGVKFLYECVMGMSRHEGLGTILADEMGLGKTLQTITLIWTLLKQNPYGGNGPVIGKAMIVCPVSLVENWRKEFYKWIGRDRIGVFIGNCDRTVIKQFINSRIHQVLVIGYERLRGVIQELAYCNPPIGLIVCDEGHRLKNSGSRTNKMFETLRTMRRVILSGTPIQNDLGEFHAMSDFCNPGLLDEYATFKRVYESPILASRSPDCTSKARELGIARAEQLQLIAKSFVLRREATILSNYLPPKFEYVVFIRPTELQLAMLSKLLDLETLGALTSSTAKSLALIRTLSKLCNSPYLLKQTCDPGGDAAVGPAIKLMPPKLVADDVSLSGKLIALSKILHKIKDETDEKCIIVSHYTTTLNIVEAFCTKRRYSYFRLDGQTPPGTRQEYVDKFNQCSQNDRFLFLLSAKAGGVGLNLIGASRLILIDGDWNPSHDLQAMARIHRDGQKRPVFIYRLLTAGTIDEKIFQRQITKLGLSEAMIGNNTGAGKSKMDSFTNKELRDLFNIYPDAACHTHELLSCPCGSTSVPGPETLSEPKGENPRFQFIQDESSEEEDDVGFMLATQVDMGKLVRTERRKKQDALASLAEWTHINCMTSIAKVSIQDEILRDIVPSTRQTDGIVDLDLWDETAEGRVTEMAVKDMPGGTVTFVFERVSKTDL